MDEQLEGVIDETQMRLSSNPRWGTVRAVVGQGEFALVLDDLNSDYREIELSIYHRVGHRWQFIFKQDDPACQGELRPAARSKSAPAGRDSGSS